jgi:ketol-acid reductoisomerase
MAQTEKSARVYFDEDTDLSILEGKIIAVIGYGNQGRAQALNIRESGLRVVIGNIEDEYREQALKDNFEVLSIAEASKKADIIMILIPDEIQAEVFKRDILPNLSENKMIDFATGYNVAFKEITGLDPPAFIDVIMIAPRMIGIGVRESYVTGEGFFSFVSVYQDHSGSAKQIMVALAKAVGTTKKGAIETTFSEEAHLDLFSEQVFGPAFGNNLRTAISVLLEAGYPQEAVMTEIILSGEFSYSLKEMAEYGIIDQLEFHSPTSQYGGMSRGATFIDPKLPEMMKKGLEDIRSGKFAREWARVQKRGKDPLKGLKEAAKNMPFVQTEKKVREKLRIKPKGEAWK